ncbi:MAG: hypothetical protein MRY32_00865 [Rickettsiales bacterium]|nr:hypothetical protein [Rickettsiales bacterium]
MSAEAKQALIPIMQNYYAEILAIEEEWGIRFKEGDMRARIEYFHDAIRALTSGSDNLYAKGSRLSIEHLAYDLSQLRQIQAKPVGKMTRNTEMSAGDEVVSMQDAARGRRSSPDRGTRQELGRLYKDYTVFFAAIFAEIADMNFQARCDEVDATVEDIGMIEQVLNKLAAGDITPQQALAELDQIEQDVLREKLQAMVSNQKIDIAAKDQILDQLENFQAQLDEEKTNADKAHMSYKTSQLAIYENSKDTVKKLAAQGLNIAGRFVENALSQGQGQGRGI